MRTKLAIVEDNPTTRDYLVALFRGADGIEVTGVYGRGDDALEQLPMNPPDVLMVDLQLPDMSGVDVIRAIKEKIPEMETIVLTMHERRDFLFAALRAGATGYLLKGSSSDMIVNAISLAMSGGAPMSPSIARFVIEEFHEKKSSKEPAKLTSREKEVIQGIASGLSEKKLAKELSLSPHTIHTHIKKIYKKLQAKTRAEAVLKARNRGIV